MPESESGALPLGHRAIQINYNINIIFIFKNYFNYDIIFLVARVAKLVDAVDSKSIDSNIIWVQVPSRAPFRN